MSHRGTKRKYCYKQEQGNRECSSHPNFSNKQVVCIEHIEIAEDDECEIFRYVASHSCVFNFQFCSIIEPEYTSAWPSITPEDESGSANTAPTPRQTPIHEL